jgi:hypothetical protein
LNATTAVFFLIPFSLLQSTNDATSTSPGTSICAFASELGVAIANTTVANVALAILLFLFPIGRV